MTDEQQRAVVLEQELLEPLDRGDVEVVGGLVEQQQVGSSDERTPEQHASAPATRQRSVTRGAVELQMREHRRHALLHLPAVGGIERVLQAAHAVAELRVGRIGREGVDDLVPLVQHPRDLGQAAGDHLRDVLVLDVVDVLIERRDARAGPDPHLAAVRQGQAADQPHQGGFAGPVAADDTDALARLDLQRGVIEQRKGAESETCVIEAEQGIGGSRHSLL